MFFLCSAVDDIAVLAAAARYSVFGASVVISMSSSMASIHIAVCSDVHVAARTPRANLSSAR